MVSMWIEQGVQDWQILQHENGRASLSFEGGFRIPDSAAKEGIRKVIPKIRIMKEEDNRQVIPFTDCECLKGTDSLNGSWRCRLTLPAGGLYRVETVLHVQRKSGEAGSFRGDIRVHIGVGNLFLIAGQSNAAGYARDSARDPMVLSVHACRSSGKWDIAAHPLSESTDAPEDPAAERGMGGPSPWLSFGRVFLDLSHLPVGLIPTAVGGSPISRWDPGQTGDLYRNMILRLCSCGKKAAGVLWYQGCTDAESLATARAYAQSFARMVKRMREEIGYEIPFFTFQLNRYVDGICDEAWGIVREAQRTAAKIIPGVYVLSSTNLGLTDGIHNHSHANLAAGERMASLCGYVLLGLEKFLAPDLSQAVYQDHKVTLVFDHVRTMLMLYGRGASPYGIRIRDEAGEVEIVSVRRDALRPNALIAEPGRKLEGKIFVSYAWEANPTFLPPVDEGTSLPVLSFYEVPVGR